MDESMISMVGYIKIQFVQAPQISITNIVTKLAIYMDESAKTLIKRCVA